MRDHKKAKRWQPGDGDKTLCRTCGSEMFIHLPSEEWWCINDPELPSDIVLEGHEVKKG